MNYSALRALLFLLDPEVSHGVSLKSLDILNSLGILPALMTVPRCDSVQLMGLDFANPVGLAAGLDKDGDYIDALAALGFGFLEIGTVTPRPQNGNPKPRLFRLPEQGAIINRMGFNNKGVDHLVERVSNANYSGVLGINIGKNFDTPVENALDDYLICLRKVYSLASYITVNISSPNTPGLRDLQFGDSLNHLLQGIALERAKLAEQSGEFKPIAIKIAPDMSLEEVNLVAKSLVEHKMDAVIATNTTLSREEVQGAEHAEETGGLSGRPLCQRSTTTIQSLSAALNGQLPIIGVGGIDDAHSAQEKLAQGASLVQIYTGFIYRGPALIREIVRELTGA